jgi:hypothetical protein
MSLLAHENFFFHGKCLIRLHPAPSGSARSRFRSLIMHYAMLLPTEQNQARQLPDHHELACRDESVWSWLYRQLRYALHGRKQA